MPLRDRNLRTLAIAFVIIVVGWSLLGFAITGPGDTTIGTLDRAVSQWMNDARTDTLDTATAIGSTSADSLVKIPATIVLVALFLWRWKRWAPAALLAGGLILESTAFVVTSFVVGRERPAIEQLDSIPPTGSFPSGHTAAAVVFYGALAIIVYWATSNRLARAFAVVVATLMPFIVGASRVYRGMHFLSDVVVGALLGVVSLALVYHVLSGSEDAAFVEVV